MWLRTCKECGGLGKEMVFTFDNSPADDMETEKMCYPCGGSGYEELTDKEAKQEGATDGEQGWYYVPF